jgi:hypothetical protein
MTHATLPKLRVFGFRGISAYVDGLFAHISSSVLVTLEVYFIRPVPFPVPRLLQVIQTSKDLICNSIELIFEWHSLALLSDPHQAHWWIKPLCLRTLSRYRDQQVASTVQILRTLLPVFSAVEELALSHEKCDQSSEWHDEVNRTQWRELLRPFNNVKTLRVQIELIGGLSRSLRSEGGEMSLELLPNLLEPQYSGGSSVDDAFTQFINERQTAGHPVRLTSGF